MQFNVAFVTAALLASASPAMSATITFFTGAGCTGSTVGGSLTVSGTECVFLTNGGSGKSIRYSGVNSQIQFFLSGGQHDVCTNGANLVLGGGSGCGTAPAG
jgi:hypothetical protein